VDSAPVVITGRVKAFEEIVDGWMGPEQAKK
jgi:hypothetical protein